MPLKNRKKTLKSKPAKKVVKKATPTRKKAPAKKVSKPKQTPNHKLVILQKTYSVKEKVCRAYYTITAQILFDKKKKTAKLLGISGMPAISKLPVVTGNTGEITSCTLANITHYSALNACMLSILKRVYQEFN